MSFEDESHSVGIVSRLQGSRDTTIEEMSLKGPKEVEVFSLGNSLGKVL